MLGGPQAVYVRSVERVEAPFVVSEMYAGVEQFFQVHQALHVKVIIVIQRVDGG